MNKKKGIFITFEGPEASGKSTQINALKKFLKKINVSFITTREPGGTIISEKLKNIILNKNFSISKNEELLLLMASRLNHINTVIKPALKKDSINSNQRRKADGIAAVIGDYLILDSDITKMREDAEQQGLSSAEITNCQLAGRLMENKLYAHQALQDTTIVVSDAEVTAMDSSIGESPIWRDAKSFLRVRGFNFSTVYSNIVVQGEYGEMLKDDDLLLFDRSPSALVLNAYAQFENLNILTSGVSPPNPSELLESSRMDKLLKEISSKYEVIFELYIFLILVEMVYNL